MLKEAELAALVVTLALVTALLVWKFWPTKKPPDPLDQSGTFPTAKRK